ncbi:hypothetical protein K2Y11_10435 [bacterium]|nr:hypothetical protein [bacterium]
MSTSYMIELNNQNETVKKTIIFLKDGTFDIIKSNWDQGIMGAANLIGSGHGWWMRRSTASYVEVYDANNDKLLVEMHEVKYPFKRGDSGTGDYVGPTGILTAGEIAWKVVAVD